MNGVYTQRVNQAQGRDGPLFRGRYKALVVEVETYLAAVIRYIHLNRVQAKLVKVPEAYRWSSHAAYLKAKTAPPWLAVKRGLASFGRAREFHEFVLAGNEEALETFYESARHQPVLGSEEFRTRLRGQLGAISREHVRSERVAVRPSVSRVVQAVAKSYGVSGAAVIKGGGGLVGEARQVAIYLVPRLCDWTLQATAEYFGLTSYGGASWACAQIRRRRAAERGFRMKLKQIEKHIL
jgi:putative transposase